MRAGATLVLDDSFSDGERMTQSAPSSAHWYTGGDSSGMGVTDAGLTFQGAYASTMANFNPVTLQVGQTLTLSFTYAFAQTATSDNNFLFGLYNSGGSSLTKDGLGFNNALFNNYTGYATSGVLGVDPSGPGRDHIEVRDKTGHNLLSIATYTEGLEHIQSGGATPGQIYEASMMIARTAQGITVESRIGASDMVQSYTSSEVFTTFDSVGIFSATGTLTIDNVKLDYAGLPEPSSCLAITLFGMAVCSGAIRSKLRGVLGKKKNES